MDSDHSTVFARRFHDVSMELDPTVEWGKGASLNMYFHPEFLSLGLSVYDPNFREPGRQYYGETRGGYTHSFESTDPARVAPFLREVEAAYGVTLEPEFEESAVAFLQGLPGALGLSVELADRIVACEQCGDSSGNELTVFFFPALEQGGPASLGVENRFGCFGGVELAGDPAEVGDEVVRIIQAAIKSGRDQSAVAEAKEFLGELRKVL